MKLRRLTPSGIEMFAAFLDELRIHPRTQPPMFLLEDPHGSEAITGAPDVATQPLETRLDAARYLDQLLSGFPTARVERDAGVWAWLTLFFFDQICPARADGTRKPLETGRYVPAVGDFKRYYRHLLLGPFRLFRAHQRNERVVDAVLMNRLHVTDELMEQLASRLELATNSNVFEAATLLYVDAATHTLKRGARGTGLGSPRRLADVLNQFDLTFDLYSLPALRIVEMLPSEFDKFRS